MITYLYWILVFGIAIAFLFFLGRLDKWKIGLIGTGVVLVIGWAAYFFHFQQVFVKHYGGVMSIKVPEGQHHIAATWKEDNLWIENYDPETNTCHFREYSKGNLLQGKVTIKNCNPLMPRRMMQDTTSEVPVPTESTQPSPSTSSK
jgi:hypothetical protein